MNTSFRNATTALLLIVAMWFSSCSDNQPDYIGVIPSDATAVAAIDLQSLAQKSDFAHSPLLTMGKKAAQLLIDKETQQKIDALIDDPSLTGIDIKAPVYAFQTPNHFVGITMRIDDSSAFEEFVNGLSSQNLCSAVKEHDGLKWSALFDDINFTFDDNTLLMMQKFDGINSMSSEKATDMMLALMQLPTEESIVSTDKFKNISKLEYKDMQAYFNLAAAPEVIASQIKDYIPSGISHQDIEMVIGVEFNNGEADAAIQLFSSKPKVQGILDDFTHSFKSVSGDFINILPDNTRLWMTMGLNGEQAITQLKKIDKVKDMLMAINLGIDIDNIIRAIDGDALVMVSTDDKTTLLATLGNTNFMNDISYWMESAREYGIKFSPCGNNQYCIQADGRTFYFAVNDKQLYIGEEQFTSELFNTAKHDNLLKDEIVGKNLFVHIDPHSQFGIINKVIVTADESGKLSLRAQTPNIKQNILYQLIKLWKL